MWALTLLIPLLAAEMDEGCGVVRRGEQRRWAATVCLQGEMQAGRGARCSLRCELPRRETPGWYLLPPPEVCHLPFCAQARHNDRVDREQAQNVGIVTLVNAYLVSPVCELWYAPLWYCLLGKKNKNTARK